MEFRSLSLTEQETLTTSPKILIVDDSESDRFSLVRYLQSDQENSYHIIEAETLEESLELWRSQQPDIVLLDINLPDGDGLEFLEEIGTAQAINKLPVIMLTGQGDERIAVQAMKLGAADYLVKGDVTAVSLLTCIGQVQENNLLIRQLRRSQNQQTIIASMALYIRQSLNFEEVANRIVQEIRRFLEADRMLIYRFNPDMSGVIVAEAVISPWLTCLNTQIEDTCFQENLGGKYQQGKIFATADIYAANLTKCHIELLERFQVRANLVVPILMNGNNNGNNTLWGLLIAHQCSGPRQWLAEDIQLLHQLSVHLSLALQQAELYQNLENLNASLEQRTQALQLQNKVLEEIHDAVVTTNLHGIILSWNHGAEKLYGYTEAEVLGRHIAFMYEEAEALQTEVMAPLLERDRHTTETEMVVLSKSGKRIDISLRLSVVKDQQGNIIHLIGVSNDISDRKRAEQELQQLNQALEDRVIERTAELAISERRYSTLASASPVGIFRFDSPLNCVYVNERWSQLTGRSTESALGRGWIEAIHPDDRDLILKSAESQFYSPLSKKTVFTGEGRHLRPDGSVNWVYFQVAKEFNEAGEIVGYVGTLTDITDRKQAELALMESEQSYVSLMAASPVGIFRTDPMGYCTYVNERWCRIAGLTLQSAMGDGWGQGIHPEDRQLVTDEWYQSVQEDRPFSLEYRFQRPDGIVTWVYGQSVPKRNDDGSITGYVGTITDITDRKLAEAALRASDQRWQFALESAGDGIWDWNVQTDEVFFSQQWKAMLGYADDEIDNTFESWENLVHPDDLAKCYEDINKCRTNETTLYENEHRLRCKDGSYKWILARGKVFERTEDGQILRMMGTHSDLSDRKQTALELQRLTERLTLALKSGAIGCWDWNVADNSLYWDDRMYEIHGITKSSTERLTYNTWINLIHPDDLGIPAAIIQQATSGVSDFEAEFRIIRPDGKICFIKDYGLVIRDSLGNLQGMIGINFDISDRKLAEAELKQKNIELQELVKLREEALTLREDMSNMIVHDLRNPLSSILLSAEIIKKYGDQPYEKALLIKKAEQILKSGNRMKAMIDSLLLMAKLESSKILFNPVPTDLQELGTSILSDFELAAQSQKIELQAELPNPGNSMVIDGIILRRVIENLLSNALKFSPPHSQVRLQMEYLPENHLRVKVIDNGPGVSPERTQEIFEKFEIGTVKANVSQIGLGLAFCKMAVEAQGGTLAIAPHQPQGSIFIVEI